MLLSRYLERIEWSGDLRPTADVLGALMRAHIHHVPFENLDVQLGKSLTTRVDDAYEKIVNRKRGGWCYEQNGLFGWALSEIGFEVQRIGAAVMRRQRGPDSQANHLTLLVNTPDQDATRWLADVGFGGSLLGPLPLETASYTHVPFKVGLRRLEDGSWQFWECANREEEFSFDFDDTAADEDALDARCQFLQTNPDSNFVKSFVCQLRLADSHKVLRGRVFSHVTPGNRRRRVLDSADELVATLRNELDLHVPEAASIWDRICERHQQLVRSGELDG